MFVCLTRIDVRSMLDCKTINDYLNYLICRHLHNNPRPAVLYRLKDRDDISLRNAKSFTAESFRSLFNDIEE